MMVRLGVNIDHVATLREARGENYPSIIDAARTVLKNGADQITIHLREDRRHIQDPDVESVSLVTKEFGKPLNLEMGCNEEIIGIAIDTAPDWVCFVPEKRQEVTTEGGLNILDQETYQKTKKACQRLRDANKNIKIALFLENKIEILRKAQELKVEAVEIHTGEYARAFLANEDLDPFYKKFEEASRFLKECGIGNHAGHGLTLESLKPLIDRDLFIEYNIGHFILAQSIFDGLGNVVKAFKEICL